MVVKGQQLEASFPYLGENAFFQQDSVRIRCQSQF
jgi:hypothetical protein